MPPGAEVKAEAEAEAKAKARAGVESEAESEAEAEAEADFQTYSRPETRGRLCFVIARLGFNVWI